MIATSDAAYTSSYSRMRVAGLRDYSPEEIQDIINSGTLAEQQKLSRNYFYKDGFYKQIIIYYATLLAYRGFMTPQMSPGKSVQDSALSKKYYAALSYVEKMRLPIWLTNCAQRALVDGAYFGVVVSANRDSFTVLDLPSGWATSNYKDIYGNDLIEFDLSYFNTIFDLDAREDALSAYPSFIVREYRKWKKGKRSSKWLVLPPDVGICFPFFDGRPLFLNIIPTILQYDKAVEIEQERDLEEIRKIIVQKIPHLTDGRLLFEPDEAEEIHSGTVGMMKNNQNVSVLTTYADVDAIVSKTAADNSASSLERMLQNIYSRTGVSSQVFSSTGSSTLTQSINQDISLMMVLANKFSVFVTNVLNRLFSNGNIRFKYQILPVGIQNQDKYIDEAYKLASSGYSILLPAVAQGFSQKDIIDVKDLENKLLKVEERFIPLQTAYTQSAASTSGSDSPTNGRPTKAQEEKTEKTIAKEEAKDVKVQSGGTD